MARSVIKADIMKQDYGDGNNVFIANVWRVRCTSQIRVTNGGKYVT